MQISVAPTDVLPLGNKPTRISVWVDYDLIKYLERAMDPVEEGDSWSRVRQKVRAAMDQMARNVSVALFGAEVSAVQTGFGWPKCVLGLEGPKSKNCQYHGICFDYRVTFADVSPRVLELTADEARDGTIALLIAEVDKARTSHINKCVNKELKKQMV